MASRLYPGFGSGKGTFESTLKVLPITARDDLECGDKIILPQSAFKEISRQKLPFPLHFQLQRSSSASAKAAEQYAGVYEFSAPPDTVLLPAWMIQNLRVKSGDMVRISTVRGISSGTAVKLRPHRTEFLDAAAKLGTKELLESCMRNYSVLSVGERIVVDVLDKRYALTVEEASPAPRISLYGTVDLTVEFGDVASDPALKADVAKTASKSGSGSGSAKPPISRSSSGAIAAAAPIAPTSTTRVVAAASHRCSSGTPTRNSTAAGPSMKHSISAKEVKPSPALVRSRSIRSTTSALSSRDSRDSSTGKLGGAKSTVTSTSSVASTRVSAVTVPGSLTHPPAAGATSVVSAPMEQQQQHVQTTAPDASPQLVFPASWLSTAAEAPIVLPQQPPPPPPPPPQLDRKTMAEQRAAAALARQSIARATASATGAEGGSKPSAAVPSGASGASAVSLMATLSEKILSFYDDEAEASPAVPIVAALGHTAAGTTTPIEAAVGRTTVIAAAAALIEAVNRDAHVSTSSPELDALHERYKGERLAASIASALRPALPTNVGTLLSVDEVECRYCLSMVPRHNADMHTARCGRNSDYHKVSCSVCDAAICKKDVASHVHCDACGDLIQQQTESCGASPIGQSGAASLHVCTHRLISCVCGAQTRAKDMEAHRSTCEAVPHVCTYCNLPFKGAAFTAHERKCGARTTECESCSKLVVLSKMAEHCAQCRKTQY